MGEGLERGRTRVAGFADAEMDYQLIRQLGAARYGGAAIGECLALARTIDNGVPASWVDAFAAAAARQQADAEDRAARGHALSARDQYLVACNSWRAAEYYSPITRADHARYGLASRACFLTALASGEYQCEALELPFADTPLPAYHLRQRGSQGAGKTLMIISGYDGTLEETFIAYGRAALERGYRVLLFAGPGQMDSLRFHPDMSFIPEFERIGTPAVDYLLSRGDTDARRIALMGISFGGYFATRIAVHEPRIRALIPNSAIVDLHAYMASFAGFDPAQLSDADDFGVADLDHIPDSVMPLQTREMSRNLMLRFGQPSFKRTYQRLRDFRVEDAQLAGLQCAALALIGAGEGAEPLAQHQRFLARVPGAQGHVFSAQEGADGHCQSGNLALSAAVSMDWLDERFA